MITVTIKTEDKDALEAKIHKVVEELDGVTDVCTDDEDIDDDSED